MTERQRLRPSIPLRVGMLAAVCVLILAGCGGGDDDAAAAGDGRTDRVHTGPPADLTSGEVCLLLEEDAVAAHLDTDVASVTPGRTHPTCDWMYKVHGGPLTNLQVQVMSMQQTEGRLGAEALEWGLGRAPEGVEVRHFETLGAPNGVYEWHESTVVLTVDEAGRLITIASHSDTPEDARIAIVRDVLASLARRAS